MAIKIETVNIMGSNVPIRYNDVIIGNKELAISQHVLNMAGPGQDAIIDSYPETNVSTWTQRNVNQGIGQAFVNTKQALLRKVKFYLNKVGSPTGTMVASLYACKGTPGSTGNVTGDALATSDPIEVNVLTSSLQLITFTFSKPYIMDAGMNYVIAFIYKSGVSPTGNWVNVGINMTNPSHPGNAVTYTGDAWYAYIGDIIFYLVGDICTWQCESGQTGYEADGCGNRRASAACPLPKGIGAGATVGIALFAFGILGAIYFATKE